MKLFIFLFFIVFFLSMPAFAHEAFTFVSSQPKTVKESDLASFEKNQTHSKKNGTTLSLSEKEIRLVVVTGPEEDMLSFRIQGVRNPTLAVPAGARLTILFVNIDSDMRHDLRFGHVVGEFPARPDIAETAGT